MYNNMAGVNRAQGNYEKALEYYKKALLIQEEVLGNLKIYEDITIKFEQHIIEHKKRSLAL